MDVETFLCQSRKKISFSKINLLNLRKNLVGPWGSTQLGERSPKPVSRFKSDTRKVSRSSSPQNRPTCTCSTLPRASARQPPLPQAGRRLLGWHKIGRSGRYGRLRAPSKRFSASHMKYILRLVNFSWAPSRKLAPASIFVFVGIA